MNVKKIENGVLTVSEIAERVGVSRNKVWSYIRKNGIKPKSKKGKTYQFDYQIVSELIQKQRKKQVKTDNNKNIAVSDDVLKIFQKQLETKDKQIEELQNTVDYFQKENLALRLESSKQKKLIADKNDKLNAVSENDLKTEKKHWWQSLF